MSNFDDIKKKIQSLKNKKPDTNISDNLNKIEMEINKDTLNLFKKNQGNNNNLGFNETTIDNVTNTNFATTSFNAQNQSIFNKTATKKENIEATNKEENNEMKDKKHREDVSEKNLPYNDTAKSNNNVNTASEIYNKNTNSDEVVCKNNFINYQAINNNGFVTKKPTNNEYLSNDINKIGSKSAHQEKTITTLKRDKYPTETNINNGERKGANQAGSKIDEMWKLLDSKSNEKEKISKQKESNYDEFFTKTAKNSSQHSTLTTIQKIQRETADISNALSGRSNIPEAQQNKSTNHESGNNNKLKDKISTLVKHLDKDPQERAKFAKTTTNYEVKSSDNKNMLIIHNPDYDLQAKNNSNYHNTLNYVSPKPKIELLSDKFFGTRSNNYKKQTSGFELDQIGTSSNKSNINNYISLTTKYHSKEKPSGKSEDLTTGGDLYKMKLNRSNNFQDCTVEQIFKIEDIKSLSNTLKYMSDENLRKINSNYCKELVYLSSVINNTFKK